MTPSQKKTGLIVGLVIGLSLLAGCGAVVLAGAVFFTAGSSSDGSSDRLLGTFNEFSFDTLDDWPGAQGIAENWQIEWPASARDIRLAEDGFQDPYYNVKMTVDPDDLDGVVASPACQGLKDQPDSRHQDAFTTQPIEWWTPQTATTFNECNGPEPSTRSIHTFVDKTDPNETILYVLVVLS